MSIRKGQLRDGGVPARIQWSFGGSPSEVCFRESQRSKQAINISRRLKHTATVGDIFAVPFRPTVSTGQRGRLHLLTRSNGVDISVLHVHNQKSHQGNPDLARKPKSYLESGYRAVDGLDEIATDSVPVTCTSQAGMRISRAENA